MGLLISASIAPGIASLPEPMQPARLVNDFAGILTPVQQQTLEQTLEEFDRSTSTQIAVVSVSDLDGMAIADYAGRLFDAWGIGHSGKDNGILLLIKPKKEQESGQVFIATGYGLEGVLPDILAGRIVDYDLLPAFREGDYYTGIERAVTTLMELTRGEYTAEEYLQRHSDTAPFVGFALALLFLFLLFLFFGGRNQNRTYSAKGDIASALLWSILFSGRPRGGGGFGGFSGGGGFGGFGGGSTGGGGAGGSW